jgi:anti-sigma factor RsiW
VSESRPTPAEQHLGDRLSALVDGELGHEARERVLSHLATCTRCRVEADAQRRLKNVFAEVSGPTPSESFLARLQGLPAGGPDELGGPGAEEEARATFLGSRRGDAFGLAASATHGFPIHHVGRGDVGRAQAERAASRSRRFAFAAASAVSLAAVALGGVTTGVPVADADRGGLRSNATPPAGRQTGGAVGAVDTRRRTSAPPLAQNAAQRQLASVAAPLLSGGAQSVPGDGPAPTPLIGPGAAPVTPGLPVPLTSPAPTGTAASPSAGR